MSDETAVAAELTTEDVESERAQAEQQARLRQQQAFLSALRDKFAGDALAGVIGRAIVVEPRSKLAVPNGQAPPLDIKIDGNVVDVLCDWSWIIAERMVLARQQQLPHQIEAIKRMQDAADAAASPAGELLKGPGAA